MMQNNVTVVQPQDDLAAAIIEHLRTVSITDWPRYDIIVPTTRFGTFLSAALTEVKRSFIPPRIQTFSIWLNQFKLNQFKQTDSIQVVDAESLRALMKHLLSTMSYKHLRLGMESEISQLFHEALQQGRTQNIFADIDAEISKHPYKTDEDLSAARFRVQELQKFIALVEDHLKKSKLRTAVEEHVELVKAAMAALPTYRSKILLCGFSSTGDYDLAFAQAIAQNHHLFVSSVLNPFAPLAKLHKALKIKPEAIAINENRKASLVCAPNVLTEVECSLKQAQKIIKSGVQPSEICILIPSESMYGPIIKTCMESENFHSEFNLALPNQFQFSDFGHWLKLTLASMTQNDVLLHYDWFRATCLHFSIQHDLAGLLTKHRSSTFSDFLEKVKSFIPESLSTLLTQVIAENRNSLSHWFTQLKLFHDLFLQTKTERKFLEKNQASFDVFLAFLSQSKFNDLFADQLFNLNELSANILSELFALEVRTIGEPLRGVQVLNVTESRFMPFQICFLLGCVEGVFPRRVPFDSIVPDYLKRTLGLSHALEFEAMENATFEQLLGRTQHLILSYPQKISETPTVRSRYVEQFIAEGCQIQQVHLPKSSTTITSPQKPEGLVQFTNENLAHSLSSTSIEKYLSCPYRYALHQMGLREFELPEDSTVRDEGILLHSIIEKSIHELPAHADDKRSAIFTNLRKNTNEMLRPSNPLYAEHLNSTVWNQLIDVYENHFGKDFYERLRDSQSELKFKESSDLLGDRSHLVGSIDHVIFSNTITLVIDYKRSSGEDPADVLNGFSPQLTLYTKIIKDIKLNTSVAAGYFSLKKGTWESIVDSSDFKSWEHLQSHIQWRQNSIKVAGNRYFADPSDCHYCPYSTTCRKNDPRFTATIDSQKQWEPYQKQFKQLMKDQKKAQREGRE